MKDRERAFAGEELGRLPSLLGPLSGNAGGRSGGRCPGSGSRGGGVPRRAPRNPGSGFSGAPASPERANSRCSRWAEPAAGRAEPPEDSRAPGLIALRLRRGPHLGPAEAWAKANGGAAHGASLLRRGRDTRAEAQEAGRRWASPLPPAWHQSSGWRAVAQPRSVGSRFSVPLALRVPKAQLPGVWLRKDTLEGLWFIWCLSTRPRRNLEKSPGPVWRSIVLWASEGSLRECSAFFKKVIVLGVDVVCL